MYDVITIGSATRDVFVRSTALETHAAAHSPTGVDACLPLGSKVTIDELHLATGGGATNAAVTFARLGKLRTACVCRMGRDEAAGVTLGDFIERGIAWRGFLQHDAARGTGYSIILLSGSGERTILTYRGANARISGRTIPWRKMRSRWFYVTSLAGDLALFRRILAHAKATGAVVAWNPGGAEITKGWTTLAPLVRRCGVFNINREEAAQLTGKSPEDLDGILTALRPIPAPQSRIVLLTDGPHGAYALAADATWTIASRNIRAVNTTGAGDAFGSAFVLGLMHATRNVGAGFIPARTGGRKALPYVNAIDFALRLAMANAEGVITHMGAKAGILSRMPSRAALAKYRVRRV